MQALLRNFALAISFVVLFASTVTAQLFETRAEAAFVLDQTTGTVLLAKNADEPLPPASMSKLMTIYMAFEAVADGRLGINERVPVSSRAASYGGSTMFLDTTDRVTIEDLLRGVIVLSGDDASAVLAEAIAGSEPAFARMMTERAKRMGMTNSTFANSSGWPHPNQRMSMHDLGVLAVRLISEFPEYYGYFGLTEFPWDNRAPQNRFNRNPLLKLGIGADGLKTGHTNEAGYGLVGSAVQGDRRIVFVLGGLLSESDRAAESERVVNWAFRQFVERKVVEKNKRVAEVPVWLGDVDDVGLVVAEDITMLIPALVQGDIPAEITYRTPLEAPLVAGQVAGELVVRIPDMPEARVDLLIDRDVAAGGFMPRVRLAARILFDRIAGAAEGAL